MSRNLLIVANSIIYDENVMRGSFSKAVEAGRDGRKEEFRIR